MHNSTPGSRTDPFQRWVKQNGADSSDGRSVLGRERERLTRRSALASVEALSEDLLGMLVWYLVQTESHQGRREIVLGGTLLFMGLPAGIAVSLLYGNTVSTPSASAQAYLYDHMPSPWEV